MTEKKTIADAVMQKIDKEKIAPKPRWQFLLSNWVFWGMGAFFLLIGALAVSAIIFAFVNGGWALRTLTHNSALEHFFIVLPIVWIVVLILFIFIADYNVRHTKRGYLYSTGIVVGGSIAASIVLGALLYVFGVGSIADEQFGKHIPGYQSVHGRHEALFEEHEDNVLVGSVVSRSRATFTVHDMLSQKQWTVVSRGLKQRDVSLVQMGTRIVVVGEKMDDGTFAACAIAPLPIRGGRPPKPSLESGAVERRPFEGAPRKNLHERLENIKNIRGCEHLLEGELTTNNGGQGKIKI